MPPTLEEVLSEQFEAVGVGRTVRERADALGVNPSTYNRVLNGKMPLTQERATAWAQELFSDNPAEVRGFAERLLGAEQPVPRPRTVEAFCDDIAGQGGAVDAQRVSELFKALESTINPLILIEYRDGPRAGPGSDYHALGDHLAEAVANDVCVAMVVPFKVSEGPADAPVGRRGMSHATKYMIDIQDECIRAYRAFKRLAETKLGPDRANEADQRLKLYFPGSSVPPTLSSGFQAKIFYIQFKDRESYKRHQKVFQWVSTPSRDLLIFRGNHISAEALRDSFFPIPHAFDPLPDSDDRRCVLPVIPVGAAEQQEREKIEDTLTGWRDFGLPFGKSLWTTYKDVD